MRPILVVNPRSDVAFVGFVREQVDGNPDDGPATFQDRLRQRYPEATVHLRVLSNEPSVVWYVYRDGRWTPPG